MDLNDIMSMMGAAGVGPQPEPSTEQLVADAAKGLSLVADIGAMLIETANGHRAQLLASGYSESIVEMMTAHFYMALVNKAFR